MAAAAEKPVAVRRAEELVEREMGGRDASHDAAHALRVRDLALSLAAEEGLSAPGRLLTVELAALLHDVGDYKYTKNNVEDMSAVEKFLEEVGLEEWQKDEIVSIIKGMGFKNEISKKSISEPTLEFAIVQDADRLDAIGAIDALHMVGARIAHCMILEYCHVITCQRKSTCPRRRNRHQLIIFMRSFSD
ncbi:unnamed protein product [Urochloa humidicola]